MTFADKFTLEVDGQRVELAWHDPTTPPEIALSYPWTHLISGHLGRLAGENVWAGVKGYLDAVTDQAAAPVIAKYTGVLSAAELAEFTNTDHVPDHAVPAPRQGPQRPRPPVSAALPGAWLIPARGRRTATAVHGLGGRRRIGRSRRAWHRCGGYGC